MRECGECSACCAETFQVPDVPKACGEVCPRLVGGRISNGRCTTYETRPERCRAFYCAWAKDDGHLVDAQRPDRCGVLVASSSAVIVDGVRRSTDSIGIAYELWPRALDGHWAERLVRKLAAQRPILLRSADGSSRLVGPPRLVALLARATIE